MSENENATTLMQQLERELGVKGPANVFRAALKIAKEAAAQAKDVEPPAPPAWMVEVATEIQKRLDDDDAYPAAIIAIRLAIERGQAVVPREWTEEELLKAAREDAAQTMDRDGFEPAAERVRRGEADYTARVTGALQARRNMLKEGAVAGKAAPGLTLRALHEANKARQTEWCQGGDPEPDLAFRGNELAGETGEACNVVKKLERERHGWRGSRATLDDLAQELADVVICADLCAVTAGIDLDAAVVAKFNATSAKQGLSTMLPAPRPSYEGMSDA